jgi:mRNA interferase RelE/StbE
VSYEIELSRIALKNMAKIPKKDLSRIQNRLEALSKEPQPDDIKKIRGDDNLYRIRSGNYRILYRIFENKLCILIVDIDHRKDIYKDF